jgi:hypothetical protein
MSAHADKYELHHVARLSRWLHMQVVNPYKRQFLVSWVAVLDRCAVPLRTLGRTYALLVLFTHM